MHSRIVAFSLISNKKVISNLNNRDLLLLRARQRHLGIFPFPPFPLSLSTHAGIRIDDPSARFL